MQASGLLSVTSNGAASLHPSKARNLPEKIAGYGGERYIQKGVIRHYIGDARLSWVDVEDGAAAASAWSAEEHNGQTYRWLQAAEPTRHRKNFTRSLDNLFRMKRAHRKSSIGSPQPAQSPHNEMLYSIATRITPPGRIPLFRMKCLTIARMQGEADHVGGIRKKHADKFRIKHEYSRAAKRFGLESIGVGNWAVMVTFLYPAPHRNYEIVAAPAPRGNMGETVDQMSVAFPVFREPAEHDRPAKRNLVVVLPPGAAARSASRAATAAGKDV